MFGAAPTRKVSHPQDHPIVSLVPLALHTARGHNPAVLLVHGDCRPEEVLNVVGANNPLHSRGSVFPQWVTLNYDGTGGLFFVLPNRELEPLGEARGRNNQNREMLTRAGTIFWPTMILTATRPLPWFEMTL